MDKTSYGTYADSYIPILWVMINIILYIATPNEGQHFVFNDHSIDLDSKFVNGYKREKFTRL